MPDSALLGQLLPTNTVGGCNGHRATVADEVSGAPIGSFGACVGQQGEPPGCSGVVVNWASIFRPPHTYTGSKSWPIFLSRAANVRRLREHG
jgi:hypothetical protein